MCSCKFLSKARKDKFKDVLVEKAIIKALEGGEERTDAQEDSVKQNDDGLTELILSISDDISFGIVDEAVTKDPPDGDLRLVWERLCNKFEPKNTSKLTELKLKFSTSKLEDDETGPEEWISKLERIINKLKQNHSVVLCNVGY